VTSIVRIVTNKPHPQLFSRIIERTKAFCDFLPHYMRAGSGGFKHLNEDEDEDEEEDELNEGSKEHDPHQSKRRRVVELNPDDNVDTYV